MKFTTTATKQAAISPVIMESGRKLFVETAFRDSGIPSVVITTTGGYGGEGQITITSREMDRLATAWLEMRGTEVAVSVA